jgi:hypothetical protein
MRAAGLVAILSLVVLGGAVAGGSPGGWGYASGARSDNESTSGFELWWQPGAAVLREFEAGHLVAERRCDGTTYVSLDHQARSVVRRSALGAAECLAFATGNATDAALMASTGGLIRGAPQLHRGRPAIVFTVALPGAPLREVVGDPESGLPLEIRRADGSTSRWSYTEIGTRVSAPAATIPEGWYTETYRTLTAAEAGARINRLVLPGRIGAFVWDSAFEYETGDAGPTTYAIWRHPGGSELQVVRGVGEVEPAERGAAELGEVAQLTLQRGAEYVRILAPDRRTIETARLALGL